MRAEIVEIREKRLVWEVVSLVNGKHHRYTYWGKGNHPDQLSAYIAATQAFKKEQTNGNHC